MDTSRIETARRVLVALTQRYQTALSAPSDPTQPHARAEKLQRLRAALDAAQEELNRARAGAPAIQRAGGKTPAVTTYFPTANRLPRPKRGRPYNAKITQGLADKIRRAYAESGRKRGSQQVLARQYRIARSTIGDILHYRSWNNMETKTRVRTLDIETGLFDAVKGMPRGAQLLQIEWLVGVTHSEEWEEETEETTEKRTEETYIWRRDRNPANDDIEALWGHVLEADVLIGYNIIDFDLIVLAGEYMRATGEYPGWPTGKIVDIFHEIRKTTGRWYKLQDVAMATLGEGKSADGTQAALWLKSGDPDLIARAEEYCQLDVKITRRLYDHAMSGKAITLPMRPDKGENHTLLLWYDKDKGEWLV